MPRDTTAAKKPYNPPSHEVLDASAAKAKLKDNGDPKDPNTQKLLSLVDEQVIDGKLSRIRKHDPRL